MALESEPTGTTRDTLISAADNRRMFDGIARRYDLLNRLLSLGLDGRWRRSAVRALAPASGQTLLDIGCGTGDVSIEILRQAPEAGVVGIDPSEAMLAIGREKLRRRGLDDRIRLQTGDATAMDFADASFDGAILAFCYRNIEKRSKALAEIRRLLRPGGRLVILELTRPQGFWGRLGHRFYNRCVVPTAGRLLSTPSAYKYLVDSIENFPRAPEVCGEISDAGFVGAAGRPLTAGTVTIFTAQKGVVQE